MHTGEAFCNLLPLVRIGWRRCEPQGSPSASSSASETFASSQSGRECKCIWAETRVVHSRMSR
eukprot:5257560-Pleurochrysis_carterae.AAC.2